MADQWEQYVVGGDTQTTEQPKVDKWEQYAIDTPTTQPQNKPVKLGMVEKIANPFIEKLLPGWNQARQDFENNAPGLIQSQRNIGQFGQSFLLAGATGAIPAVSRMALPAKMAIEGAAGAQAFDYKNNIDRLLATTGSASIGAGLGAVGSVAKNVGKLFSPPISPVEAERIATQYGNSNAALVDQIKSKVFQKIQQSKDTFSQAVKSIPENFRLNINSFKSKLGLILKEIGLIDSKGNAISSAGEDRPLVKQLLAWYKNAKYRVNINAKIPDWLNDEEFRLVKQTANKVKWEPTGKLTSEARQGILEALKNPDTIDKTQYLRMRDQLDSLPSTNPKDERLVSLLKDALDESAYNSGATGMKKAKQIYHQAKETERVFINSNTGDLRVASEQALNRVEKLPKQTLDQIKRLASYIGHDVIGDASKINSINKFSQRMADMKKYGVGLGLGVGGSALAGLGLRGISTLVGHGHRGYSLLKD